MPENWREGEWEVSKFSGWEDAPMVSVAARRTREAAVQTGGEEAAAGAATRQKNTSPGSRFEGADLEKQEAAEGEWHAVDDDDGGGGALRLVLHVGEESQPLGIDIGNYAGAVLVEEVDEDGVAAAFDIQPEDELYEVREHMAGELPEDVLSAQMGHRPQRFVFMRYYNSWVSKGAYSFMRMYVNEEDEELGFGVSCFPPATPVLVEDVEPSSVAEECALRAGDELTRIGDADVAALTSDMFVVMIQARPQTLRFQRSNPAAMT
eukprot:TRINITY_DN40201_c0_g1_i1.p2 TRINITY_DN40201_c0_g1~~TRINITY_DN40201_c0_g1_i1.p2  ORF type:complete len:264 (+),score=80.45 TRINITY_DN40201_c0_g1_i1:740-1531(+)